MNQVQNGDLNWVVPGKLLAFAGPTAVAKHFWGYRTFTPEDYHQYFADTGVTAVVRLNNEARARTWQHHQKDVACSSYQVWHIACF